MDKYAYLYEETEDEILVTLYRIPQRISFTLSEAEEESYAPALAAALEQNFTVLLAVGIAPDEPLEDPVSMTLHQAALAELPERALLFSVIEGEAAPVAYSLDPETATIAFETAAEGCLVLVETMGEEDAVSDEEAPEDLTRSITATASDGAEVEISGRIPEGAEI